MASASIILVNYSGLATRQSMANLRSQSGGADLETPQQGAKILQKAWRSILSR